MQIDQGSIILIKHTIEDECDDVMCAYEFVNLVDEDHVMEELTIQELVCMVTGGEGENENDDQEEEGDVEKPLIPATVAQSYLHEMS